jgi:hypothetical protein
VTSSNNIPHSKKVYFDKEIVTKWVLENKISTQEMMLMANKYLIKKSFNCIHFSSFSMFFIISQSNHSPKVLKQHPFENYGLFLIINNSFLVFIQSSFGV